MLPVGFKRPLDVSYNPNKRPRIVYYSVWPTTRSLSPFQVIPYEIVAYIFKSLSSQDLLNFETACFNHSKVTHAAWYCLREKHFFRLDWNICQGSHKLNYRLSKALIHYIQNFQTVEEGQPKHHTYLLTDPADENDLDAEQFMEENEDGSITIDLAHFAQLMTSAVENLQQQKTIALYYPHEISVDSKHSEKFKDLCEICPPFKALIQLTQMPKNQIGILEKGLQEDDVLLCLAHIYQFAQQFWIFKKNIFNLTPAKEWDETQKKLQYFNNELKPKIKNLIAKGATYLHDLTIHLFIQFSLIKNNYNNFHKGDPFYPSLIELTHEAFIHGNELAYKHFWQPSFKGILEAYAPPHLLEDEGFKAQMLIQHFMQENALVKGPEIHIKSRKKSDKTYEIDNLFHFDIDFMNNDDDEDEKLTLATHELVNKISLPVDVLQSLLALHYLENRGEKFDQCLEQLLKKGELSPNILLMAAKLHSDLKQYEKADLFYDKYLTEQEVFGQDKEPDYFKCVLLEALEVKIELDHKKANCHINKYIDKLLLDRQERPVFISTNLLQRCLAVKKAINDERGAAWFEGLDYLLNTNPLNYLKADELLEVAVYQTLAYPLPPQFLFKAADVKLKREKWQEAEWFYDRCLNDPFIKLDFNQTLNIALVKYQVGNFNQAIELYTSVLDHLPDKLLKQNVYTHLVEMYITMRLWDHATEICHTVIKHYGEQAPSFFQRQLVVIADLYTHEQELASYQQEEFKSTYNDFYTDFDL